MRLCKLHILLLVMISLHFSPIYGEKIGIDKEKQEILSFIIHVDSNISYE